MKPLPKKIIRIDDGAEFLLDEITRKYELWIPGREDWDNVHHQYTYERLMEDERCKGAFKIADGTEDLLKMKNDWFKRVNEEGRKLKGCGDYGED